MENIRVGRNSPQMKEKTRRSFFYYGFAHKEETFDSTRVAMVNFSFVHELETEYMFPFTITGENRTWQDILIKKKSQSCCIRKESMKIFFCFHLSLDFQFVFSCGQRDVQN